MSLNSNLILIGVISAAHGIKGEFVVKSFSRDPSCIDSLNLVDGTSSPIKIHFIRVNNKGGIICTSPSANSRNEAEKLIRTKLYCKREDLPDLKEDEFYHSDLIGIEVRSVDVEQIKNKDCQVFKRVGVVKGIFDFGAGDLIEISFDDGKDLMFLFNKDNFPEICKDYVLFKTQD